MVSNDNRGVAVKPRPELAGFFAPDCQVRGNRIALAEVTGVEYAPLQAGSGVALYFPLVTLPPEEATPKPPAHKRPRLAAALDAELAERARYESLRDLAVAYGVGHETIRGALQRRHRRGLAALAGN